MESNTNNISSAGLHGRDQRQHRSGTYEEVDVRHGQKELGSLLLSTGSYMLFVFDSIHV